MSILQKGIDSDTGRIVWLVLDDDYNSIEPIQHYLNSLMNLERSPNTIHSYAQYLKFYWDYLKEKHLDWRNVSVYDLSEYIYWLRVGNTSVLSLEPVTSLRSEKTINHAMTVVMGFYEFHSHMGAVGEDKNFSQFNLPIGTNYKSFLAGIAKTKPRRKSLLKLKEPKKFVGCLSPDDIKVLADACNNIRDKLIIMVLYETGIRKGELLGLRHEDIGSTGENKISIIKRNNINGARVKSNEREISISKQLIQLYNEYLINEYPDIDSDYVFVNIWSGQIGSPMNEKSINELFKQLKKRTGIHVYPHLLRHTHATELIQNGIDIYIVSKRLGHSSISTTLNTYAHLTEKDLQIVID